MCFHDYSLLIFFLQKRFVNEKLAGKFSELTASSIMVCPDVFSANDVAEAMLWSLCEFSTESKTIFLANG